MSPGPAALAVNVLTVGGFGGFQGRGLKKGDQVRLSPSDGADRLFGRRSRHR